MSRPSSWKLNERTAVLCGTSHSQHDLLRVDLNPRNWCIILHSDKFQIFEQIKCHSTKTKFKFHHVKSFENVIPSLSPAESPHAMLGETRISTLIWADSAEIPSKSCQQRHVPGLPIREYTKCCNNLLPVNVKLIAINMIVNATCERLYLVLCWR